MKTSPIFTILPQQKILDHPNKSSLELSKVREMTIVGTRLNIVSTMIYSLWKKSETLQCPGRYIPVLQLLSPSFHYSYNFTETAPAHIWRENR